MEGDQYVKPCDPTMAMYDPACRARKRASYEVAYQGYGIFRGEYSAAATVSLEGQAAGRCTAMPATGGIVEAGGVGDLVGWNAWMCTPDVINPARLVIESLDEDAMTRSIGPVALQSGGYVTLLNGGKSWKWDGYLQRRSTFITTVAVGRDYDLAYMATNPQVRSSPRAPPAFCAPRSIF